MQIVIDIPNSIYANLPKIVNGSIASKRILDCVKNGTPLPKGHGRLIDAAWNLNLETSYDNEKVEEMLKDLPHVTPQPKTQATSEIDNFVSFLIRENCEGCKECEPRLSADWKPKFACVEEGRAKWLLSMAEKYKAESEGKNDN